MQLNKRSSFIFIEQDEWNEKAVKRNSGLQPDFITKHCDPEDGREVKSKSAQG